MSAKIIDFPVKRQTTKQDFDKAKGREKEILPPVSDRQSEEKEDMFPPEYFMLVE